jgi:hypothetical protein
MGEDPAMIEEKRKVGGSEKKHPPAPLQRGNHGRGRLKGGIMGDAASLGESIERNSFKRRNW